MTISLHRVTRINGLDGSHPHVVLKDVSLTFPADATIGVLGLRGSGKSTVVKLLTGALQPTHGLVRRHGRVSFPIGSFGWMNRYMTGRENIHFLARLYGLDAGPIIDFIDEAAGLGSAFDQNVAAYSGDKRSRLAFAAAYAFPFDVYVADEFLIGGPPGFRDICKSLVRARQGGSTIILFTRSPSLVRLFCTVGGVMHDGGITLYDHVEDAIGHFYELDSIERDRTAGLPEPVGDEAGFWSEELPADGI